MYEQVSPPNKKYFPQMLDAQNGSSRKLRIGSMDAIDRKILAVLQEDASLSVAEVGNRVGLSSTPCWKRIQKLEAEGVIQKRVAVVDPEKIGLGVSVFVAIETGDHSEDRSEERR